eukprot:jgi/Psemu1/23829/gm1.23829_g
MVWDAKLTHNGKKQHVIQKGSKRLKVIDLKFPLYKKVCVELWECWGMAIGSIHYGLEELVLESLEVEREIMANGLNRLAVSMNVVLCEFLVDATIWTDVITNSVVQGNTILVGSNQGIVSGEDVTAVVLTH